MAEWEEGKRLVTGHDAIVSSPGVAFQRRCMGIRQGFAADVRPWGAKHISPGSTSGRWLAR
ncbi:hypothetical protein ACRALDRAFT_2032610 [Sodiomyces alcalophilus JCM 7366]|uniref:uncharacterized protein n=1 Tax=Sodiomyces alcalophilus JCM 7366 TaxID=591952 RepID=UPI0039B4741C